MKVMICTQATKVAGLATGLGVPNPGGLKHVLDRLKWALGLKNGRLSLLMTWFALRNRKWGEKLCTLGLRVFRTTRVRAAGPARLLNPVAQKVDPQEAAGYRCFLTPRRRRKC